MSRRDAVIIAARELLRDQGRTTAMSAVRERAGVSNGSLFHYFPTRASLLSAVYLELLGDYHGAVLGAFADGVPAEAGLRDLVARHRAWVEAHPRDATLLSDLRSEIEVASGPGPAPWHAVNADALDLLHSWLGDRRAEGSVRDLPREVAGALILAPLVPLSRVWLEEPGSPRAGRAEQALADALVRAVVA